MTLAELRGSIRRVLGVDLPLGEPTRLCASPSMLARPSGTATGGSCWPASGPPVPRPGRRAQRRPDRRVNLGWKLAAAVHGRAPAGLLDTYDDERRFAAERTLLHAQAQVALRRGHDAAADALRELFQELLADEQPRRRLGALMAGTDIRYPGRGPDDHPLTGAFAPDLALRTVEGATSVAELLHAARPVLLDLADRDDLRQTARAWQPRIDLAPRKPTTARPTRSSSARTPTWPGPRPR